MCLYASWALKNLAWARPAHRTAIVAAGAVAPLAEAVARHPGATRAKARGALAKLGYKGPGGRQPEYGALPHRGLAVPAGMHQGYL